MRTHQRYFFALIMGLFCTMGCEPETASPKPIEVLSVTLNGAQLSTGAANVPVDARVEIAFSAALDPAAFEGAFSLTPSGSGALPSFAYLSQSSRVRISLDLMPQADYTLRVTDAPIGQNGERLEAALDIAFTTASVGVINSMPPCTAASSECLQTVSLSGASGAGTFDFYASFPIYEAEAEWLDLKAAVIMVHGLNRNADDYFSYLMTTLLAEGLAEETILIAPFFKQAAEAQGEDFYWSGSGWREGRQSASTAKISSFAVLDQLIEQLADRDRFPVLERIIVIGQSSGGLFAHLYAGANRAEAQHTELAFHYVVGESQYFYYPDGRRVEESSQQLYTPTGCAGYDLWPLGFDLAPPYLVGTSLTAYNDQFVNRSLTYLLGNGSGSDGALNTTDCSATLLGTSRYSRGENMFQYMELAYPGVHGHQMVVAPGISHDGSLMYQSAAFRALLLDLLD